MEICVFNSAGLFLKAKWRHAHVLPSAMVDACPASADHVLLASTQAEPFGYHLQETTQGANRHVQPLKISEIVAVCTRTAISDVAMQLQGQSATKSDIQRLESLITAIQQKPDAPLRVPASAGAVPVAAAAAQQSQPPDALMTALPAAMPPPTRAAEVSSHV